MALRWRLGASPKGPEFVVASDNITTARVDAIVNSAVSTLTHWRKGVAAEIVKTGGGDILYDCRRWIQRHTRLEVGQAMATRAGKLPCTYVIHVHCPRGRWRRCSQPSVVEAIQLRTTIRNALREADRFEVTSIAIPGILCDGCENSKERATKEIVDACVCYAREYADTTTLKSILFLDTDMATHDAFVNALQVTAASVDRGPQIPTRTRFEHPASDDPDYRRVLEELPADLLQRVVSIRRVRASAHCGEYEKLKKVLVNASEVDDLYHGTPDRWRATAIALDGFDLSILLCGRSYGDGVYASTNVRTAFNYTRGKGSIVKLRGLVHRLAGRNVQGHVHLFPNPKTLLPLMIIDYVAEDEQDRALVFKAHCQV